MQKALQGYPTSTNKECTQQAKGRHPPSFFCFRLCHFERSDSAVEKSPKAKLYATRLRHYHFPVKNGEKGDKINGGTPIYKKNVCGYPQTFFYAATVGDFVLQRNPAPLFRPPSTPFSRMGVPATAHPRKRAFSPFFDRRISSYAPSGIFSRKIASCFTATFRHLKRTLPRPSLSTDTKIPAATTTPPFDSKKKGLGSPLPKTYAFLSVFPRWIKASSRRTHIAGRIPNDSNTSPHISSLSSLFFQNRGSPLLQTNETTIGSLPSERKLQSQEALLTAPFSFA